MHPPSACFAAQQETEIIEGSLEVKLSTIWTDGKQSREEAERREREERRSEEKESEESRRRCAKRSGVRKTLFFPMISGSGGLKRKLAKAAEAEPAGQMRADFLHAVVARSRARSENAQSTPWSEHFLWVGYRKSARRLQREAHFEVKK